MQFPWRKSCQYFNWLSMLTRDISTIYVNKFVPLGIWLTSGRSCAYCARDWHEPALKMDLSGTCKLSKMARLKWLAMPMTGMVVLHCTHKMYTTASKSAILVRDEWKMNSKNVMGGALPDESLRCAWQFYLSLTRPVHVVLQISTMVRHCPYGVCRGLQAKPSCLHKQEVRKWFSRTPCAI